MENYKSLLLANKAWVKEKLTLEDDYFENLSKGQQPTFLWVGCSDSRVPAEEVTGTAPGEIFVHRNIANLIVPDDLNVQSVLHYAIEVLKVKHVIVCGHYGCGGVKAATTDQRFGIMDQLNVLEQLKNIMKTKALQKAWHSEKRPTLHGWVFGLQDGLLRNLYRIEHGSHIDEEFRHPSDAFMSDV